MRKIILSASVALFALTLYACNLTGTPTSNKATVFSGDTPALSLAVQAQGGTYNAVGQTVNYSYMVTNLGNPLLAGPVTVADDKTTVTCPAVNTVGNKDNNLDHGEIITCTSAYGITQADLNSGSVTSNATAKAGGVDSNKATTVVQMTANKVLAFTYTANPTTYSQEGQTITFTFSIKNTGTSPLGPAQFVVSDSRMGSINCGASTASLAPNETLTCPVTYTITQNDMSANQITANATASGGGAGTIQAASITITNVIANPGSSSTTIPTGSIQHQVVTGEWLWQISRCYGVRLDNLSADNREKIPNPSMISPGTTLIVKNPGSFSKYFGPPCIGFYIVQGGDSWNSIAQKYNADIAVLQAANNNATLANGSCIRVPLNSAGGNATQQQISLVPCNTSGGGTSTTPTSIRINFPAGSSSVTLSGTIESAKGKARYVLNAAQGQTLSIRVTAPANEVALAVYAPNGSALKPQDGTLTWSGTIPTSGDYIIELVSVLVVSNKSITLEVGLTTPQVSSFERVADINPGAGNSDPSYLSVFNGALYFKATGNDNAGAELWKYDAIVKAPSRVSDINPGAGGSDPSYLAPYNSALYFSANNNDGAGIELYRFNGTSAGRVTDINAQAGNASPAYMTVYNNILYFSASGSNGVGRELWKTDGNGASLVADINTGPGDSNPSYLTVYNNALYFSAVSNDGKGVELYKYDGTNVSRVFDLNSGVGNSNPSYLTIFNNQLYFSANGNDNAGTELWKFDGTTPTRVADINPGVGDSGPAFLTAFNNALYFSANGNDGMGTELWKFDGTNVKRVSDLNTAGNSNPAYLTVYDSALYFSATASDGAGNELWKFKGP